MRPLLLALALLPWLAASPPAAADDPSQSGAESVGKFLATEGKVSATLGADTRSVVRGEAIYQGDWIETERKSRAKIELNDETELVVGPGSRLHIDEFVYNSSDDTGKVLLEMGVGLLRFSSGVLEPQSYEVKTPVASIGVRGTLFDLIVASLTFATTVILREGVIAITSFGGSQIVNQEDNASTAPNSTDEPEAQRKVTKQEEDLVDPLKKPFKDELPSSARPRNLPSNMQKPNIRPHQGSGSKPSNRPNIPSGRY